MKPILMLALGLSLIGLTAPIYAQGSNAGNIYFRQDGLPVTSVVANTRYVLVGYVNGVKNTLVDLCVVVTPTLNQCVPAGTDAGGHWSQTSLSDPTGCNFEIAPDGVTCDFTPRTLQFQIIKRGSNSRIIGSGSLEITAP